MLEKIQKIIEDPRVKQFKDVRVIGLSVFAILVLLVSWSGIRVVQTNYELQRQISRLEQETEVSELGNTNTKLKNQYLETDEYLELTARRQFGKAAPGETLLLVPKNVALAYTIDTPTNAQKDTKQQKHQPFYQRNFEAWMDFFLHRTNRQ